MSSSISGARTSMRLTTARPKYGRSQIHAARNLEARVAERAGLAQQHLVAIGTQESLAGRFSPVANDHAGDAPRLAGPAGASRAFVGHRHSRAQRRIEERLVRLDVEARAR